MKKKNFQILASLIIGITLGLFFSPLVANNLSPAATDSTSQKENPGFDLFSYVSTPEEKLDLALFWDVWQRLQKVYVDDSVLKDEKKMSYGATKGLVQALGDPYTVFMDPEETKEFMTSLDGQLDGIGAELEVKEQNLVVVSPIKGSPAEKAGLLPGDIIYKINDELASDMSFFQAITKIRGERGTVVHLAILREKENEPLEFDITRDVITIESVQFERKDGNIAYIALSQFTDHTKPEFNKVVSELLLDKPKGIILDLRYNGGGYLDSSVDILSDFIEGKKEVVKIKTRNPENDETKYVSGNARLKDIPLVVLVNGGSASASEIVAGAIQDLQRGLVIGEKTFGKGSVQEVMDDFRDGSSMRVTIAKWLTPNGRSIQDEGIEPDRVVEITPEDLKNEKDSQLEAALDYLKGL